MKSSPTSKAWSLAPAFLWTLTACAAPEPPAASPAEPAPRSIEVDHTLSSENTHNRWSRAIPPVLTVPSGAVVEIETKEASDGQLALDSTSDAIATLDFDPIHPLTGPIYVETAEPGDVLAVTFHEIEVLDWGWTGVVPGFGFLADEFPEAQLKTFRFDEGQTHIQFNADISIPVRPMARQSIRRQASSTGTRVSWTAPSPSR